MQALNLIAKALRKELILTLGTELVTPMLHMLHNDLIRKTL